MSYGPNFVVCLALNTYWKTLQMEWPHHTQRFFLHIFIVYTHPSVYLSVCLSIYLSIYLSVYQSIYLSIDLASYVNTYTKWTLCTSARDQNGPRPSIVLPTEVGNQISEVNSHGKPVQELRCKFKACQLQGCLISCWLLATSQAPLTRDAVAMRAPEQNP